jgi:8-oxo-dGTP pyrophosphatase MutT (NUDIX family)
VVTCSEQAGVDINVQSAAIPYRTTAQDGVEVLLITSRKRSRWAVPKGKVKRGVSPHHSAAREAFEEAGVIGTVSAVPLGTYNQMKAQDNGESRIITVQAFPFLVVEETERWPEKALRRRCWMPIGAAVDAITNGGLKALLATFAKTASVLDY